MNRHPLWLVAATIVLSVAALPPGTYPGACQPWVQVNDDAFGLDSGGSYSAEEGFEVLVFNDQLYVGMEADNTLGARLWRTKAGVTTPSSQADWEEVVADADGQPFGVANITQNDHIDSLAEFDGYLYVSTANGGSSTFGTRIFRSASGDPFSTSPGAWSDAIASCGAGFGDVNNTNFKDMQVFDGWLCGGTQNWNTGAQVWCTDDGATWTQKNFGGFGAGADDDTNVEVWSGYVYSGALYFGVQNTGANRGSSADDVAKLFRATDLSGAPTWTEVYGGISGSRRVDILGDLNDYLYISVRSSGGIVILRSPSGDAGSWTQVNTDGMDSNAQNSGAVVDSATVYNGVLYVGVANVNTGFEVWRTTGALQGGGPLVDWAQVDGSGLGDPNNYYTELIPFNGYLYAWTSNYSSGQQVLRTKCPIEQTQSVSQTGVDYTFTDPISATVNFSDQGNVTEVTVQVYPGAWATESVEIAGKRPVKRHYAISANGSGFTATLTLSYTDTEFTASDIDDENTTYLTRWTGSEWFDCPTGNWSRDTGANTVTCSGVTAFSTWAIAASDASPTAVKLAPFRAWVKRNAWRSPFLLALAALLALAITSVAARATSGRR